MTTNKHLFFLVIFVSLLALSLPLLAKDVVEVEPNDVAPTALDNHDRGLGAISPAITDNDSWSLHGGSVGDQVFVGIFSMATGNPDTNLTVYNNDGHTVIETDDDDAIGKQSAVAGGILTQPGKVVFNLHDETNNQAIGSYQVCGVVTDPVEDGANESESNDDAASADPYDATIMFGDLDDGTPDYFAFSATAGQPVMVIMDDDPDNDGALTDSNLDLLDTDGSSLLSGADDDATHNANATEVVELPADGTYYVRVSGGGPDTDYSFVVCGIKQPGATIGDFVWDDRSNKNGLQDPGEAGVVGLKVFLIDDVGNEVDVTTTDSNGSYVFPDLHDSTYRIRFEEPVDIDFTLLDAGADDIDSDADENDNGRTASIVINNHVSNSTVDAGLIDEVEPAPTGANLGDKVFDDQNGNGIDDGEPGISGVTVNLLDASDDSLVATVNTNAFGIYSFDELDAAIDYIIEFVAPAGKAFTTQDAVMDDTVDSDADTTTGRTATIDIGVGATDLSWDAGLVNIPSSISDFVWDDVDRDGIQDGGELGISGVTVKLFESDGVTPAAADEMTAGDGSYAFNNLAPGTYFVEFVAPIDKLFTVAHVGADDSIDSDANPSTGRTPAIVLAAGEDNDTVDAGLIPLGTISDFVWHDLNENGLQDMGEPGLEGVVVNLLDASQVPTGDTDTTSSIGAYSFPGLAPGTYHVQFVLPEGFLRSTAHVGADDSIDSDADDDTGITPPIVLAGGEVNDTVDAGFIKPLIPPCQPDPVPNCTNTHLKAKYIQKGIFRSKVKLVRGTINPADLLDGEFLSLCVWFDGVPVFQTSALADDPGYFIKKNKLKYKNRNNPLGIFRAMIKAKKPGKGKIMIKSVQAPAIPDDVKKVDIQVFNANGCWGQTLTDVRIKRNKLGVAKKLKARTQ